MNVKGEFTVNLQPLAAAIDGSRHNQFNQFSIGKTFSGELNATSVGQMLSVNTPVKGSAGYVALEYVTGTLGNRSGGFVLQHFGVMSQGRDRLVLEVVPDSGEGDLQGLSGSMLISVVAGRHYYDFDYQVDTSVVEVAS